MSTNLADCGYVTDALADALSEVGFACHVLGDSKQRGNLRDAIEAGYKAACELQGRQCIIGPASLGRSSSG